MNLADAIRQATLNNGASRVDEALPPQEVKTMPKTSAQAAPAAASAASSATAQVSSAVPALSIDSADPAAGTNGNFVRLELFLAPEQLSALLSAVVKTQHSVLTLREAAAFLRLPAAAVEQMAAEKRLPAFAIDGKWRFSHQALEEWTATHKVELGLSEAAQ